MTEKESLTLTYDARDSVETSGGYTKGKSLWQFRAESLVRRTRLRGNRKKINWGALGLCAIVHGEDISERDGPLDSARRQPRRIAQ